MQLIFGDRQLLLMPQPAAQRLAPLGSHLLLPLAQTLQGRRRTGLLLTAALLLPLTLGERLAQLLQSLLPLQLHLGARATAETLFAAQTQGAELLLQLLQGPLLLLELPHPTLLLGGQRRQLGLRLLMTLLQPLPLLLIVEELLTLLAPPLDGTLTIDLLQPAAPLLMAQLLLQTLLVELQPLGQMGQLLLQPLTQGLQLGLLTQQILQMALGRQRLQLELLHLLAHQLLLRLPLPPELPPLALLLPLHQALLLQPRQAGHHAEPVRRLLGPRWQQPFGALAQGLPALAQLHPLPLQLRQQLQLSLLLLRQLLLLHLALSQGVLPLLEMQLQEALLRHQALQHPLGGRLLMGPRVAG